MAKQRELNLSFPLGGVSRRVGYWDRDKPYTAPWAVNVRGVGLLENRVRGGSRPGLEKFYANHFPPAAAGEITAIASARVVDGDGNHQYDLYIIADGELYVLRSDAVLTGESELHTEDGVAIEDEDGNTIVFDSVVTASSPFAAVGGFDTAMFGQKLYIADSALAAYDPSTSIVDTIVASAGVVPTLQPLVTAYRGRLFLAGVDHIWYACRQGDVTDWNFNDDYADTARAIAGQSGEAGQVTGVIKAMIPYKDKFLAIATPNSLHVLSGEPSDGNLFNVSDQFGIIAPKAWAVSPEGTVAFLSYNGVYLWKLGSSAEPVPFSDERVPELLKDVDVTANIVLMEYDIKAKGFHLFVTPEAATVGTHWWLDLENKAMWPVILPQTQQPVAIGRYDIGDERSEVVLGCKDGYLRNFSASENDDDETALNSYVILGPFRLTTSESADSIMKELRGTLADNAGTVTWRAFVGSSAEDVGDDAVAAITALLAAETPSAVKATGTWAEDRNRIVRPRVRGQWCAILLSSADSWAYQSVAVTAQTLGRLRNGY